MGTATTPSPPAAAIAKWSVHIERELLDRFLAAAAAQDRSGAAQIRRMVREFVREHERGKAA